jgi:RNA polymerase subunit RPABC4/transcription elongation factor Spt4
MRYENVSSLEELNFRVMNYQSVGYELEYGDNNHASLVKDDFSTAIFIILLLFGIILGLIYWAIKSGKEDRVIIQLDRTANNMQIGYSQVPNVPVEYNDNGVECSSCGFVNEEGSNFCFKCGNKILNDEKQDLALINECSNCGAMNEEDSKFCSDCGTKLN